MVYIMLAQGFEETEAVTPGDLLRRADIPTAYVGVTGAEVTGSHGMTLRADLTLEQMDLTELEMIVLPGGRRGVENLLDSGMTLDAVRFAYENGKLVAAICAAPSILAKLHITDGRRATCYPEPRWTEQMTAATLLEAPVVRDGQVITGDSAGCAVPFGLALVEALRGTQTAEAVARGIVIR